MNSTDDTRTDNNTLRHKYRTLSEEEKVQVDELKDIGGKLWKAVHRTGEGRSASIAKTKIEEAVMWAVKHVTQEKSQ